MPLIRPANPADCTALCQMIGLLAQHHGDTPGLTPADLDRDLFGPQSWAEVLVADGPTGLMGYAALTRAVQLQHGGRTMDLHHLFVQEAARGQGLGKALVQAAIDLAQSRGCLWLTVGTAPDNLAAQAVYPKLGFKAYVPQGARFSFDLTQAVG